MEKIKPGTHGKKLQDDLEKYRAFAMELGASGAVIVKTEDIPVDETVTLKCQVPRCFGYGACAHCPPHTLKPAELREHLKKFRWAVFFTVEVPPDVIVRNKGTIKERIAAYQGIYEIVSELESAAFYDGYYLSFGFGAGSCRHTFCSQMESCVALEGKKCRFALRARPSMEAVGIDVFKMAAQVGFDIYPIGSSAKAEDVPKGVLAGIVIIG